MMPLGNSLLDEKTVDSLSKTDETELPSGGCCANDSPTKKDNDDSKDHYAVLNLPQDASVEEIKKSYRRLSLKWHPDRREKNMAKEEAEIRFQEISEAYSILGDAVKRTLYDQYEYEDSSLPKTSEGMPPRPRKMNEGKVFNSFYGKANNPFNNFGFSDTLLELNDSSGGKEVSSRKKNERQLVVKKLQCTLEELFHGCTKKVLLPAERLKENINEMQQFEENAMILNVEVKPGAPDGSQISVKLRKKDGGRRTDIIGFDFVFEICQSPHSLFSRDGHNLVYVHKIGLQEALSGFVISLRALSGEHIRISCPTLGSSADEQIIRGQGFPLIGKSNMRGDLIIRFIIKFNK